MLAFRSAIRKLFGISIPGVDETLIDETEVIQNLRSALEEAESELIDLRTERIIDLLNTAHERAQLLEALGTIMLAFNFKRLELVDDNDSDDYE